MTPIAPHITAFLHGHLVTQRGASEHTCDTYASSFQLLFEYASRDLKVAPSQLWLEQIDASLVTAFLEYLENVRANSPSTRNVRLAAIRSFFRFVEHRVPSALEQVRRVLAIPFKKTDSKLVPYLNKEEMQALLDAPDPSTREGIRDRAMLHLALAAGLRVSELIGLRMGDLSLQPSASILVRGKGRRERALPLWRETTSALRAWLAVRGDLPQFQRRAAQPLGIRLHPYQARKGSQSEMRVSRDQTRLAARAAPYLCDVCPPGHTRHQKSVPLAWPQQHPNDRDLHTCRP